MSAVLCALILLPQAKLFPTLKDKDFTDSGEKIVIGEAAKEEFLKVLGRDVQVHALRKFSSMETCVCLSSACLSVCMYVCMWMRL